MAGIDTAVYSEVFKTVYASGVAELIATKVPTLSLFEEGDSSQWGGLFVEQPVNVARTEGVGWGTEGGNLPTAGKEKFTTMRIPARYHYGRVTFTAQVMKQSQGNRNAFVQAQEREMKGLVKTMAADRGRAILHDGRGVLALVNGTATSATQTLDSPGGVAGATNGSRFIRPGMIVGTINATSGAVVASTVATVTAVAAAGSTITLDASKTWTDNNFVVRFMTTGSTDVGDTSYAKEIMGLLGLIDDGTYVSTLHQVNRTTYPIFQSAVIGSASNPVGAISADLLQRAIDVADERGDGEISDLIMHQSVRRAYLLTMDDARRYVGSDLSRPDAGTVAAKRGKTTFGGISILEDKYAPYGIIFGVDRSGFKRWVLDPGGWMDEDGAVLARTGVGSSGVDAFEATYRIWDNFSNEYPNRSFRLDGVSATVTVVNVP